jgi:hypothetical protein
MGGQLGGYLIQLLTRGGVAGVGVERRLFAKLRELLAARNQFDTSGFEHPQILFTLSDRRPLVFCLCHHKPPSSS